MVADLQVRRLKQKLMEGKTQETAAAAAGMVAKFPTGIIGTIPD